MEAVLARQRQGKAELFARVLGEYRSWSRGETTSYVDGSNVPSLRSSQLSIALVHDWAFSIVEGELGNGEDAGEVRNWDGWVHLLAQKFKLPPRHARAYEDMMRRDADRHGGEARRRRLRDQGQRVDIRHRMDAGAAIVGLSDDLLITLFDFAESRDINALARTSKALLQRTVSLPLLWQSLCFPSRHASSESQVEAAIRRSAGELHTLVLPTLLTTQNSEQFLVRLAEEGYFDKLQRLYIPDIKWADAFEALLASHPPPRLHTLVCRISILWKIGDVHEKVYARLPSLQRVYLRGKHDRQPDPHQAFGLPPSSRVDFLSTTGHILRQAALSPHIKHLQLRDVDFSEEVTLPSVERLDAFRFKDSPFRSAHLPCVRVLTLHLFYGLAMLVDWLNDGPILQYPSLEAVMFKGPADWWEGPRWSAHDFMSFVIRLWKDAIPRLKYVVFKSEDFDFASFLDGSSECSLNGWRFHFGRLGDMERRGIVRPLPQVVSLDSCKDRNWRRTGNVMDSDGIDFDWMVRDVRPVYALVGERDGH